MATLKESLSPGPGEMGISPLNGDFLIPSRYPYELSRPSEDPRKEPKRGIVVRVEEVNPSDPNFSRLSRDYLRLLKRPANRSHFTGIYNRVEGSEVVSLSEEAFEGELRRSGNHTLAAFNVLGEVVGLGVIEDAARGQSDSWLTKVIVVNSLQNKHIEGGKTHVGSQVVDKMAEWAFRTPTSDGRERTVLRAAVVRGVANWQRMEAVLDNYGFQFGELMKRQAEVLVKINGKWELVKRHVQRLSMSKEEWILKHPRGKANN